MGPRSVVIRDVLWHVFPVEWGRMRGAAQLPLELGFGA